MFSQIWALIRRMLCKVLVHLAVLPAPQSIRGLSGEHAVTWCLAYVHPKAIHCSGERGKGLGLSGGNSQGWPCPGKDSAVGVWHPKTIPGSPIQHQFKAGYLCGSCISWRDAVRGGGGAVPVPGPCRDRVRVPHPQGHNWAHAGSLGIKDTNKQYLLFFFFNDQVNQDYLMEEHNPQT